MAINYIRNILIGRVFKFYPADKFSVILGVRRSKEWDFYGKKCIKEYRYYEILIGRMYNLDSKNVNVLSWYYYRGQKQLFFHNRSSRKSISKCMKKHPDKIQFHTGRKFQINDLTIFDNLNKQYKEYLKSL